MYLYGLGQSGWLSGKGFYHQAWAHELNSENHVEWRIQVANGVGGQGLPVSMRKWDLGAA